MRRVPLAMWNDNISDWAAALTYYAVLALVPALLVTLSLIGLVSPDLTDQLIAHVTAWAPAPSGTELQQALRDMADERSAALTLAVAGGIGALWSASSYLAVFRRALHTMHGVPDQRPLWHRTGPLAMGLGRWAGVGGTVTATWYLLRWPVLVCLVTLLVLILFRTGPPAARRRSHALPGGAMAALLWLVSSACFSFYASGIGNYGQLYGSLAGVVVFLIWLWVSHLALLAGAQFAVELSRLRQQSGS
jgi:membrane protein